LSVAITLEVDTGRGPATVADVGGYTTNVAAMWHAALGHPLEDLTGRTAGDCEHRLDRAVTAVALDPARYRRWNPDCGVGDYEGALAFLFRLLLHCQEHPGATIRIGHPGWAPYAP
jgi:hypothetical protein